MMLLAATLLTAIAGVDKVEAKSIHGYAAVDSMPVSYASNALANHKSASNSYGFHTAVTLRDNRYLIEGSERDYIYDHEQIRSARRALPGQAAIPSWAVRRITGKAYAPEAAIRVRDGYWSYRL